MEKNRLFQVFQTGQSRKLMPEWLKQQRPITVVGTIFAIIESTGMHVTHISINQGNGNKTKRKERKCLKIGSYLVISDIGNE
jgi:uncharacterized protein YukJ